MPEIFKKSQNNLRAAQYLIEKGFFTESVHCSYYSSFQYMKYILSHLPKEKKPISYKEQNEKEGPDTHDFILTNIIQRVGNPAKSKDIGEFFRFLKNERKLADYRDKKFEVEDSLEIKQKSESLQQKLRDSFGRL